jgi:hypothetical protein
LQHSENTFCKKLGFQNAVLMVHFFINHMLSIENQHFRENIYMVIADAASEPEASEQVSSSNSYWAQKVRFYFRSSDQNALLLTDQNALLLADQNALHA